MATMMRFLLSNLIKEKQLDNMKYIKIDKDAVYEILREHFIDNSKLYFDEKNIENKVQYFYLDKEMNFICVEADDNVEVGDMEKLSNNLPITTKSVFSSNKKYKKLENLRNEKQMFQYRVSKYNPELRDENQAYAKEEWTSYSDIGKEFSDGVLSKKEYLKVEKEYIDFIYELFNEFKIEKIKILKQEPKNFLKKTSYDVDDKLLYTIIQKNIREEFWCKFKVEQFQFYMGYDFYLHIDFTNDTEKLLEQLTKRHNLFLEKV